MKETLINFVMNSFGWNTEGSENWYHNQIFPKFENKTAAQLDAEGRGSILLKHLQSWDKLHQINPDFLEKRKEVWKKIGRI